MSKQYKITEPIITLEGEPIKTEGGFNMTWRQLFGNALNDVAPNEVPTAEDKNKRFSILQKLYKSNDVKLSVDDAAAIKERIGSLPRFSAEIYGLASAFLEGEDQDAAPVPPTAPTPTPAA